jgi:hypothetical protein
MEQDTDKNTQNTGGNKGGAKPEAVAGRPVVPGKIKLGRGHEMPHAVIAILAAERRTASSVNPGEPTQ